MEKFIELPYNSFLLNGEEYGVNCVFQVWKKKNFKRIVKKKNFCYSYIEFGNVNDFDFIVRRVGGNAGKAYILKEVSTDEEEIVYQMVEDDVEFSALAKIFSELTDDETALEY